MDTELIPKQSNSFLSKLWGSLQEPVIFWKYTGKKPKYKNSAEFMENVAASENYEAAKEMRDKEV